MSYCANSLQTREKTKLQRKQYCRSLRWTVINQRKSAETNDSICQIQIGLFTLLNSNEHMIPVQIRALLADKNLLTSIVHVILKLSKFCEPILLGNNQT